MNFVPDFCFFFFLGNWIYEKFTEIRSGFKIILFRKEKRQKMIVFLKKEKVKEKRKKKRKRREKEKSREMRREEKSKVFHLFNQISFFSPR